MNQRTKVKEQITEKPVKPECHHFWVIDVANGPTSYGTCKYCGEKKRFLNAFPTFNPLKKNANLFNLPKLAEVPIEKANNTRTVK